VDACTCMFLNNDHYIHLFVRLVQTLRQYQSRFMGGKKTSSINYKENLFEDFNKI
jgi:hypothetical protein